MSTTSSIPLGKRVFLSFGIAWLAAVSLGNIYGARAVGRVNPSDLWIMGVIQIATTFSSIIAVFLTPLIAWVLRSYAAIKWILLLWLIAVIWVLVMAPIVQNLWSVVASVLILTLAGLTGIRSVVDGGRDDA
jgi:hypothetical protein